jgi:hypothetical protein
MFPHVIPHKIINHMVPLHTWCTWPLHKLICESQCTMTKFNLWNLIIKLTFLNNHLSNCVNISSYTSSYRSNDCTVEQNCNFQVEHEWTVAKVNNCWMDGKRVNELRMVSRFNTKCCRFHSKPTKLCILLLCTCSIS